MGNSKGVEKPTAKHTDPKVTSGNQKGHKDMSISGSLKRFHDKWMKPQGEDGHYTIVHDVIVAVVVVMIIVVGIYGYTNTWPPVVVVESGSMQHDIDEGSLGVIDTGDIVMVKKVDSIDDITPWSVGKNKDYKTYGEYGDVIIYDKNGEGGTPVIHRAIVFIRHNETVGGVHYFDVPEWNIFHERKIEYQIEELNFEINYTPPRGHDGYLTKGDNVFTNKKIDQESGISDVNGRVVEQVSIEWVIGVARGEVPWFGLIKLYLTDNPGWDAAPDNSKTNLYGSLILLLGVPIILNVIYYIVISKSESMGEASPKDATSGSGSGGKDSDRKGRTRQNKVKIGKGRI